MDNETPPLYFTDIMHTRDIISSFPSPLIFRTLNNLYSSEKPGLHLINYLSN